jgi:hypothetical protein
MVAAPERSSLAIAEGALRAGPVACELTANELRAARTAVAATDAKSVSQTRAADLCRLAHETYKLCIGTRAPLHPGRIHVLATLQPIREPRCSQITPAPTCCAQLPARRATRARRRS